MPYSGLVSESLIIHTDDDDDDDVAVSTAHTVLDCNKPWDIIRTHTDRHMQTRRKGDEHIGGVQKLEALTAIRRFSAANFPDETCFPLVLRVVSYAYTP